LFLCRGLYLFLFSSTGSPLGKEVLCQPSQNLLLAQHAWSRNRLQVASPGCGKGVP
jgi:hypothetical protein